MEEPWGEPRDRAWYDSFPIAPYRRRLIEAFAGAGSRVLEVGSGPAHDSLPLAERGWSVFGVDYSANGLRAGSALYAAERRTLIGVRADARALPFKDGGFDLVWNAGVLEHFVDEDVARILREMARVTRPGGIVLAVVPNRYYFWYQAHLALKRRLGRKHQYDFERAFGRSYLVRQFQAAGVRSVRAGGTHLHPAPSFLIPKTGWLTRALARVAAPLERYARPSAARAWLGLDLVVWGTK